MRRRDFLLTAAGAAQAAPNPTSATILYADHTIPLAKTRPDAKDLWVRRADLPRINQFELKPQGACRADICIPISKDLRQGDWFNLTGFARKIHQAYVSDSAVWSFGEIPLLTQANGRTRAAQDFAVPDRHGRTVHLSDFRGKKVLIVTWASW